MLNMLLYVAMLNMLLYVTMLNRLLYVTSCWTIALHVHECHHSSCSTLLYNHRKPLTQLRFESFYEICCYITSSHLALPLLALPHLVQCLLLLFQITNIQKMTNTCSHGYMARALDARATLGLRMLDSRWLCWTTSPSTVYSLPISSPPSSRCSSTSQQPGTCKHLKQIAFVRFSNAAQISSENEYLFNLFA